MGQRRCFAATRLRGCTETQKLTADDTDYRRLTRIFRNNQSAFIAKSVAINLPGGVSGHPLRNVGACRETRDLSKVALARRAARNSKKACHPERSEGGKAGEAESKDLQLFLITKPRRKSWRSFDFVPPRAHPACRDRPSATATARNSAQDDSGFVFSMRRCAPRCVHPDKMDD